MHELQRFEQLVHDVLLVDFFEDIRPNYCVREP